MNRHSANVRSKGKAVKADLGVCGRTTEFFVCLGRDGALRRPDAAARRPYLRRILSRARCGFAALGQVLGSRGQWQSSAGVLACGLWQRPAARSRSIIGRDARRTRQRDARATLSTALVGFRRFSIDSGAAAGLGSFRGSKGAHSKSERGLTRHESRRPARGRSCRQSVPAALPGNVGAPGQGRPQEGATSLGMAKPDDETLKIWKCMTQTKDSQNLKTASNHRSAYNITGVAGEYFVAAELSRRGWIATITLKNTKY